MCKSGLEDCIHMMRHFWCNEVYFEKGCYLYDSVRDASKLDNWAAAQDSVLQSPAKQSHYRRVVQMHWEYLGTAIDDKTAIGTMFTWCLSCFFCWSMLILRRLDCLLLLSLPIFPAWHYSWRWKSPASNWSWLSSQKFTWWSNGAYMVDLVMLCSTTLRPAVRRCLTIARISPHCTCCTLTVIWFTPPARLICMGWWILLFLWSWTGNIWHSEHAGRLGNGLLYRIRSSVPVSLTSASECLSAGTGTHSHRCRWSQWHAAIHAQLNEDCTMHASSNCSVICALFKATFLWKWSECVERLFLWPITRFPDRHTYSVNTV